VLLALLVSACRTTMLEAEVMPFHLALAPFDVLELSQVARPPAEEAASPGKPLLGFEGAELAREFGRALDGLSFSAVTVLALPEGVTATEFARWPRARSERHWIESASACGADLLLLAEIEFDPLVRATVLAGSMLRALNDGLFKAAAYTGLSALSASVSLLMTVIEWGSDERRHSLRAGFDGTLLELGPLLDEASEADLGNRRTQLVRSLEYETDVIATFSDRQSWLGHLLSIFIPGALFPSNPVVLARHLRESIAEGVLAGLVEELEFRKHEILQGEGLFQFRVERLALERADDGSTLCAEIVLSAGAVDVMDGYRLWLDGELVRAASFGPPRSRAGGVARYELRLPLGVVPAQALLRLELSDGAPRQNVRTFTLRPELTGARHTRTLALHLPTDTRPPAPGQAAATPNVEGEGP
jgi:hypothetical protein